MLKKLLLFKIDPLKNLRFLLYFIIVIIYLLLNYFLSKGKRRIVARKNCCYNYAHLIISLYFVF